MEQNPLKHLNNYSTTITKTLDAKPKDAWRSQDFTGYNRGEVMQEVYIRTLEIMGKHNKRHSSNKPVKRKEEAIVPRIPKKEEAKVPRIPKLTTMLKSWSRGTGVDRYKT